MRILVVAAAMAATMAMTFVGGVMAQEKPEAEKVEAAHVEVQKAEFRFGFATLAAMAPDAVGQPLENERARANGDTHQMTAKGLMAWRKIDNVPAFTDGATTWLLGPSGLEVRGNDDRFAWEKDRLVGGADLRGDGTMDDNLASQSGADDMVGGVKLRGDGTVDDNLASQSGADDMVGGVKLRGDGTVDDNSPSHSGVDDVVGGVKLRGDGTVDDNSPRQSSQSSSTSSASSSSSSQPEVEKPKVEAPKIEAPKVEAPKVESSSSSSGSSGGGGSSGGSSGGSGGGGGGSGRDK